MPIGWFIVPFRRRIPPRGPLVERECEIIDFHSAIVGDGGDYSVAETLGNRGIVKVRASLGTLQSIANASNVRRLPKDRLDDSLSTLTQQQKTALRNELLDAGYTTQEIQQRLGNDLGGLTLRDVLQFMATRRRKPRYDPQTDTLIIDGDEVPGPRTVDDVNKSVTD